MSRYHLTTVVSQDHLYKFIALAMSLRIHCQDYRLFVLCAHDTVLNILRTINFEGVVPISLSEVEDQGVLEAKCNRHFHAYCWTLKPVLLHYVMQKYPDCEYLAHLDADLFFFSSPQGIFDENPEASLFLTHHRNSKEFLKFYGITGVYNTGFVGCRNDETALAAVTQWRNQCVIYCPINEDPVNKLFGDQRYVESWPEQFRGVHVVRNFGANTALWNVTNYSVSLRDGKVYLDDWHELIFYHFSGLTIISRKEFNLCWYYHIDDERIVNYIYKPYLTVLAEAMNNIARFFPWFDVGFLKREYTPDTHYYVIE